MRGNVLLPSIPAPAPPPPPATSSCVDHREASSDVPNNATRLDRGVGDDMSGLIKSLGLLLLILDAGLGDAECHPLTLTLTFCASPSEAVRCLEFCNGDDVDDICNDPNCWCTTAAAAALELRLFDDASGVVNDRGLPTGDVVAEFLLLLLLLLLLDADGWYDEGDT